MRKANPLLLAIMLIFIIGAGYGKSNIMEKQISPPSPDLSVTAREVKPGKASPGLKEEIPCRSQPFHPFTIHLEMNQYKETALEAADVYANSIGQTFITKTPVSNTAWYSVDHGAFESAKDAVTRMQELKAAKLIPKDAYVGAPMPYGVELATAATRENAIKEVRRVRKSGVSAYVIQQNDKCFRVMYGAYPNEDVAGFYEKEIRSLGLSARVAPR
ncbi:MAG TPA: SPOR domain-containing protein [Desulfomonilia bacterium]